VRILARLASVRDTLFRKERLERELDDELSAAVETLADRFKERGMPPAEACRAAIRELGGQPGLMAIKQDVRASRVGAGIDAFALDVRHAARGLTKSLGLTGVIVATLALGIGANTAIFSVVHAMLVAPLPYRNADRLLFVWADRTANGYPRAPLTGPELRALRDGSRSMDGFGAIWSNTFALTDDDPEQLRVGLVTTDFFDVLGADPAFGRTFRREDGVGGNLLPVLLSWEIFERRFGGDPSIVGRGVRVNDRPATIVGVMPKTFRLLLPTDSSVPDHLQAWAPLWPDFERTTNRFLRVIGRMRPGVTPVEAREDIATVAAVMGRETGIQRAFTTVPLQTDDVREIRGPLIALFAGVGILLAIACVNVAGLLIARAAARSRETALKVALGVSRGRLIRQTLVEGLLLTFAGAAAGLVAGFAGLRLLRTLTPDSLGRLHASRIDVTVMTFTLGVSVAWGLLLSLAPLVEVFRAGGTGGRFASSFFSTLSTRTMAAPVRYRTRSALVVIQVALSVLLLVSAALMVRAFVEVLRVDPGFGGDRVLTFRLSIPDREIANAEAFNAFGGAVLQNLAAIPGVINAGAISHIPYDDLPNWGGPFGATEKLTEDSPNADTRAISPGLFETLGVPMLEGRNFTDNDQNPKAPVAIVDEKLARQLWPGRSAVGQTIYVSQGAPGRRATVVGVVRHLKLRSLVDELTPQLFVPWRLAQRNPIAFAVKTDLDPSTFTSAVRAAVARVSARVPIYDVRPMDAYVESARATRRFTVLLAAAFSLTALLLTTVGVYGVLAYSVARRRHEFGVRRALGAGPGQVVKEVLREGLTFAGAGCLAGLLAAAVVSQLLQGQLYGVAPYDPLSYVAGAALVVVGAVLACWVPARRAMAVSPMDALRSSE
jgi:predicted permease